MVLENSLGLGAKMASFAALFENPANIRPEEFKTCLAAVENDPKGLIGARNIYTRALHGAAGEPEADAIIGLLDADTASRLFNERPHTAWTAFTLGDAADPEWLEKIFRDACDYAPEAPGPAIILLQLLEYWGKPDAARAFIDENPRIFDDPANLLSIGENIEVRPAERERVQRYVETLDPEAMPELHAKALSWQLVQADWQIAESEVRRLGADNASSMRSNGNLRQLIEAPESQAQWKPLDDSGEVLLGHTPGDHAAVMIFSGIGNDTLLRSGTFARYLASLGATILVVRDRRRLMYMRGLKSLAPDLDGTIVRLREIVTDLGIDKISTFGLSAGGFGAIVYGLGLRARATLCSSPPSDISPRIAEYDVRGSAFRRRIAKTLTAEESDLLTWLNASSHNLPITIYFGADNVEDRIHAERLAGHPGVTLRPMEGVSTHSPMLSLPSEESILQMLAEGLAIEAR